MFGTVVQYVRTHKVLSMLLAVALLLHIASACLVFALRPEAISTTPDPLDYRLAALNIKHYGTFSFLPPEYNAPQLVRSPGYPVIVAVGYFIDGETGFVTILLQSLLVVVSGWLLFLLLKAFSVPDGISLITTAVFLFEPLQWLYTLHTMTETVATFLVLIFFVSAFCGKGLYTLFRAAFFGAGLGVALLIKPTFLMWVPFLLLLTLFPAGTWRTRALRLGAALVCLALVLSPYLARNYALTGAVVLSSSGQHNLVYLGNTIGIPPPPHFEGTSSLKTVEYNGHTNEVWLSYTTQGYAEVRDAADAILENPDNYFPLILGMLRQVPTVWFGAVNPTGIESVGHYGVISQIALGSQDWYARNLLPFDLAFWTVLLILVLIGSYVLVVTPRYRWRSVLLLGIALATIFINFGGVWVRGLIPIYPVIALVAAVGVAHLFRTPVPSALRRAEHDALESVALSGSVVDLGGVTGAEYIAHLKGSFKVMTVNQDQDAKPDLLHDLEQKIPVSDMTYDHALLINVLEHIFEYRQLLAEATRIVRPGGRVVVIVPFMFPVHPSPQDYRRFTAEALRRELAHAGLSDIRVTALGSGVFAARYLFIERLLPYPARLIGGYTARYLVAAADWLWTRLARLLKRKYDPADYALGYLAVGTRT